MDFSVLHTLAAAAAESSGNPVTELARGFRVDVPMIIAQAVNFLLVAFILYRFAFKPILATIEERQEKIASGLAYAEEMKEKLAEAERKHEETVRKAQQQSQKIVQEARDDARSLAEKQRQDTAAQVEEMLRKGRKATELEREKMLAEVRGEIRRLVVLISGRVLGKELSEDEKTRINSAAAREVNSAN